MPDNLFFGTSIATCILVLAKNKTEDRVLFIDASKEFKKEGKNNVLDEKNINTIIKEFRERSDKEYFSRYVDRSEIEKMAITCLLSNYVNRRYERKIVIKY